MTGGGNVLIGPQVSNWPIRIKINQNETHTKTLHTHKTYQAFWNTLNFINWSSKMVTSMWVCALVVNPALATGFILTICFTLTRMCFSLMCSRTLNCSFFCVNVNAVYCGVPLGLILKTHSRNESGMSKDSWGNSPVWRDPPNTALEQDRFSSDQPKVHSSRMFTSKK